MRSSLLPVTPVSVGSLSQSFSQLDFYSLPSFQPNDEDRFSGKQRVYPTEVEVHIENCQVEDCLLDDSMEQDEGSEEIVLSSNSPPFLGWNGDPLGGSRLDLLSPLPRVSLPLLGGTVLLTLLELV